MEKIKYYSLKEIMKKQSQYKMIFGKRSNGKTFACLEYGIKKFFEDGSEMAYIRRNIEDLRGKRGRTLFDNLVENGLIEKYSKGIWTDIYYYGLRWYFCRWEKDEHGHRNRVTDEKPFCNGFALSGMEHDKSSSYPRINTIIFDEFLTRGSYLPDEFILFMNTLSTIARLRTDVVIFMVGNTVNKYCPYFAEMGLSKGIRNMREGTIDVYKYGETGLRVAVEYTSATTGATGKSNVLFAFDNPKLQMITHGNWEIDIYPHLPYHYTKDDIIFEYFIEFDGELLHCEILRGGTDENGKRVNATITYIHTKTTEIKNPNKDIIFTPEANPRKNYYTKITKPVDKLSSRIAEWFKRDKVFFQSNEVGEILNNYLKWCGGK